MSELPRCEVSQAHPEIEFVFVHDCKKWSRAAEGEGNDDRFLVDDPAQRRSLPLDGPGRSGWVWIGEPGRTIHPSIHCTRCGAHGFWTDGEWRPV